MLQRFGLTVCVAWTCLLGVPFVGWGQEKKLDPMLVTLVRPDPLDSDGFHTVYVLGQGIVQKTRIMILQTDQEKIYCYLGLGVVSFAGVTYGTFLGSTPLGAFSAFVDGEASAISRGPGLGVHWYVWEGVTTSFRYDVLQSRLSVTTTITP